MPKSSNKRYIYASFWQRLGAISIDYFLILLIYALLVLVLPQKFVSLTLVPYYYFTKDITPLTIFTLPLIKLFKAHIAIQFLLMLINYAYSVYLIGHFGQTIGKKIMGIKVIDQRTFRHPTCPSAFTRETIGKFISGILFGFGFLWMNWDDKKQSWHDKLAHTIVIKV